MELTGQPMIDVGYAIAACHAKKKSVTSVTAKDINHTVARLLDLLGPSHSAPGPLRNLKVLGSYWQNNPFSGRNLNSEASYRKQLEDVPTDGISKPQKICQVCGKLAVLKDVNRSWFPLAGSSESDPCSLPNLTGKMICSTCFGAVVILPLGGKFIGNNPFFFHMDDAELLVEAMQNSYEGTQLLLAANSKGHNGIKIETKLPGRLALLEAISGSLLWDKNQGGILSKRAANGATVITFSNSATGAILEQLHLPAQALDFFAALKRENLQEVFLAWGPPCSNQFYKDKKSGDKRTSNIFESLCDSIRDRRSLAPLLQSIVRGRKLEKANFSKEEHKVLEIYEDIALGQRRRFDLLKSVSRRISEMDGIYRESFIKRLSNTRTKQGLLRLLTEYAKHDRAALRLSHEEIESLALDRTNEAWCLLYLMCVAEE